MDERISSKRTAINMVCSIGVMIVNLAISFFLSPYIIRTIGVEANGFVALANNFVTYANLIVTALNAMAARFITIAYVQRDYKRANLYYNSVFWGNLIIVAVLLLPSVYFVAKIENYIDVPVGILWDVKLLFSMVFVLFFLRTGFPNWDCGTGIANRMDLYYIPEMCTSLLRCILLVAMFSLWTPHVWYVTATSLVNGVLALGAAGYFTHKLTPELRIDLRKPICSWAAIVQLVGSGIWSAIATAGNMLTHSLDLLICNIYLGSTMMGVLSLAKIIPSILTELAESIRHAFGPELVILYAQGDKERLHARIKTVMKITLVLITIPTAGIIVMADRFYSLWVPTQDARLLWAITVLAMGHYALVSGIIVLYRVFTLANQVKYNAWALIVCGALSLIGKIILLHNTELGVFAVVMVSFVVSVMRDVVFTIPVTSKLIGLKWYTFYPQVGQSLLCCAVIIGIGLLVRTLLPVNNWITFFLVCSIIGVFGLCTNMMIALNKEERSYLITMIAQKLNRKN